jgi:hypothetical protein
VLIAMMSFVAFFLLWRLLARLVGTTHVSPRAVADPRAFFLVSALAWAAQTLTDPMPCALSRADELAADDFGLALTRAPAGWIDDERRFVLENYDDPVPHPLRQLRSTHPHGVQRIARVCTRAPAMCDDVLGKPLVERARVTISLDPSDDKRVREALRPEDAAGDPGILVFFHTEDPTRTPRAVVTYAREWRSGREESVVVHDAPSLASDVRTWDGRSGFSHEHERRGDVREDRAVFKRRLGTGSIDAVRSGERLAHTLFSIPQQRFAHNEPWEKLRVGVTVETLQWTALLDGNPVVLERWRLPDGSALLEVSATCSPERAESVHAQLAALVTRSGAQVAARPSSLVRSAMLAVHPHTP